MIGFCMDEIETSSVRTDKEKSVCLKVLRELNRVLHWHRRDYTIYSSMKNTLVVVTDLAGFKAYRVDGDTVNRTSRNPRLQLLEEFENPQAHERMGEKQSDLSGRFPRRTGASSGMAMSDGERHNIELESRRRSVRKLATRLNSLMRDDEIEQCFFAASREISNQLINELDPQARAKIGINISVDLTKVNKSELMSHFH